MYLYSENVSIVLNIIYFMDTLGHGHHSIKTYALFQGARDSRKQVGRALLGGHAASIAKTVLHMDDVRESIIVQLLRELNEECNDLCKRISPTSPFQTLNVDMMANFKWTIMIDDLQIRAPLFYKVLDTLTSKSDLRNIKKVGAAHYPGICCAAAVILKERNREMCGLQSLVSLLMHACHCEKQVCSCA